MCPPGGSVYILFFGFSDEVAFHECQAFNVDNSTLEFEGLLVVLYFPTVCATKKGRSASQSKLTE